jgi:Outer membrane protein beta-barrel domain
MKNLLFLGCFLCLIIQNLAAQEKSRRFKFGIQAGSIYANRHSFEQLGDVDSGIKSAVNDSEDIRLSVTGGLFTEFAVSPKTSLRVGTNYLSVGWRNDFDELTTINGETFKVISRDVFNFLEIPLEIRHEFIKNWLFQLGGSAEILLNDYFFLKTKVQIAERKTPHEYKVSQTQFALRAGISRAFYLKKGFVAEISPRFQYFLTPLIAGKVPLNRRLWDAGIQFSVKI